MSMRDSFYIDSDDVTQLMAIVEDGLGRRHGQDLTIGAIRRLADLREKRAVPLLRRALSHSNVTVRTDAALALHKLGDQGGLKALIAFLSDDEGMVSAIRALAETKDARAIEALQELKNSSGGRSHMFNGKMTPLNIIIDKILSDAMPEQFAPPTTGSESKSRCFVATAVYGSDMAAEVIVLTRFRDHHLKKHWLGHAFISLYYNLSPLLASWVKKGPRRRSFVKNAFLRPVQLLARLILCQRQHRI